MTRPRTFLCARVRPSRPGDGLPVADSATLAAYADRAMLDSLRSGEAPFPWPGLNRVLDDSDPSDRAAAIGTCLAWLAAAERVAVYADFGISEGMRGEIDHAYNVLGLTLSVRYINPKATP